MDYQFIKVKSESDSNIGHIDIHPKSDGGVSPIYLNNLH